MEGQLFISFFSIKPHFLFKTRNQPMNFAMLPKYYIGKIPLIDRILAIFAHKSRYASFLNRVFGNPSCYFVYNESTQILCTVPYNAQPSDCISGAQYSNHSAIVQINGL